MAQRKKRDIAKKLNTKKVEALPKKIPLTAQPKNLESVKEQADEIHKEETKVSPTPPKRKVIKTTRLNVVLDRTIVKEIKKEVAEKETTIKEYITELVKKDLGIK